MPRIAPVTGKSDVPAEHHDVVDQVLQVFGGVRPRGKAVGEVINPSRVILDNLFPSRAVARATSPD